MNNFYRLKRVSWKSKNNVYIYTWKNNTNISQDFPENIDLFLRPTKEKYSHNEIQDLIENIKKIDEQNISKDIAAAALDAMNLYPKYYWKNIILLPYK